MPALRESACQFAVGVSPTAYKMSNITLHGTGGGRRPVRAGVGLNALALQPQPYLFESAPDFACATASAVCVLPAAPPKNPASSIGAADLGNMQHIVHCFSNVNYVHLIPFLLAGKPNQQSSVRNTAAHLVVGFTKHRAKFVHFPHCLAQFAVRVLQLFARNTAPVSRGVR